MGLSLVGWASVPPEKPTNWELGIPGSDVEHGCGRLAAGHSGPVGEGPLLGPWSPSIFSSLCSTLAAPPEHSEGLQEQSPIYKCRPFVNHSPALRMGSRHLGSWLSVQPELPTLRAPFPPPLGTLQPCGHGWDSAAAGQRKGTGLRAGGRAWLGHPCATGSLPGPPVRHPLLDPHPICQPPGTTMIRPQISLSYSQAGMTYSLTSVTGAGLCPWH